MKKTLLIAIAFVSAIAARGQQASFVNVTLQNEHGRQVLHFSVPAEKNVRHYRIEAGDDSTRLETITTIPARNNSVFKTDYLVDVSVYHHAYYRVGKVEMGGGMPYSSVVHLAAQQQSAPWAPRNAGGEHIAASASTPDSVR